MEHMTGSQYRLTFLIILPVSTQQIAVTADNFLFVGIPYNQLLIAVLAGIELVNICLFAGATTSLTKSNLTQSPYLTHHIRRIMCRNDVDFIVALVRQA